MLDEKKYIKFLITEFSEFRDFIQLINGGDIYKLLKDILSEKLEETIKSDVLSDDKFSKIYLYLLSITSNKRVQVFVKLLKDMIEEGYLEKEVYFKNRGILENGYNEYKDNFNIIKDDGEIFKKLINSNQIINFSKFSFMGENGVNKLKQNIVLGGRFGVGKTVGIQNLTIDAIESNKDIAILLFGTSEVDRIAMTKRIMVMRSNKPINYMFDRINNERDKKKELEEIINILDYNINDSIKFISKNIKSSGYEVLLEEVNEIESRKNYLKEELIKLRSEIKHSNKEKLEIKIKFISSEMSSLDLKTKEIYKTVSSYLNQDMKFLDICKSIFFNIKRNFNNTEKSNDEFDFKINWNLFKNKELSKNYLELIVSEIIKVNSFLNTLSKNEKCLKEIKNEISNSYNEMLKGLNKKIKKIEDDLYVEYNKTLTFLKKENVEIEDNLDINFIENKIKNAREKYKDKKLVFMIDYQQKVSGFGTEEVWKKSKIFGEKILDFCTKYNCFGIVMTQLNDIMKTEKGSSAKSTSFRPSDPKSKDGEGTNVSVGSVGIIFNRDVFPLLDEDGHEMDGSNIDKNFVIYEIYLTKNRYGNNGYHSTKQYFIFDKKKMTYLSVNKKYYSILDTKKDLLYLDQFKEAIREKYNIDGSQEIEDLIE